MIDTIAHLLIIFFTVLGLVEIFRIERMFLQVIRAMDNLNVSIERTLNRLGQ